MRTSEFSLRKFNKYTFIFVISLLFKTNFLLLYKILYKEEKS